MRDPHLGYSPGPIGVFHNQCTFLLLPLLLHLLLNPHNLRSAAQQPFGHIEKKSAQRSKAAVVSCLRTILLLNQVVQDMYICEGEGGGVQMLCDSTYYSSYYSPTTLTCCPQQNHDGGIWLLFPKHTNGGFSYAQPSSSSTYPTMHGRNADTPLPPSAR